MSVPGSAGTLSTAASQIRIVADESTNSLLIRATQADYQLLQGLVQQIDLRPLQVLIEVTIAEVQRSKDLDLGLSGTATRKGATATAKRDTVALLPGNVSARDFIFQLTGGNGSISYLGALSALQTRGDVKVLSLPVIIAQNNKEAKLNVGEQRPFVQVNQSVTTGTVPTTVQTVQYINVGTTLTITPTINPDGQEQVASYYMKTQGPDGKGGQSFPALYQDYVGHDNNRDAYMMNMIESRVMEHAWRQWEPQIIYVQHQSSPFPTRIWLPPFAEPIATHAPYLMSREVNTIGMQIAQGLEERNMVGATHMGNGYGAERQAKAPLGQRAGREGRRGACHAVAVAHEGDPLGGAQHQAV